MSEAELHILASRMDQARRSAAARGELRLPLPAGYVRDDEGAIVFDPDQEVQAAVADLFAAFVATGSAYGVVGAFKDRMFPRRPHGESWELAWVPLSYDRVLKVLANPVYAGAYAFGRHRSHRGVAPDGSLTTRHQKVARQDWETLILDHHPGYISWERFCDNEARLAINRTNTGARPPREGSALCQGIIHCGGCGRPMAVHYLRGSARYDCSGSRSDHATTPGCRSVRATSVDEAVAARLLAALSGEEVALALAAADEVADRRARSTRAAELAVERARYQADRADRALLACEPENRLVARSLEARFEARLKELAEAEAALGATRTAKAPMPPRAELEAAVADLGQLWSAPTTSDRDRKRLLRTLIADVTLLFDVNPAQLRIGLRWRSGASEEILTERVSQIVEAQRAVPDAVEMVRKLGPTTNNVQLAARLNAAGHRTGTGRIFDAEAVRLVRRYHAIPPAGLLDPGEATVRDVSNRLGVTRSTVIAWIGEGVLTARRDATNRFLVAFGPEAEARCRQKMTASRQVHRDAEGPRHPAAGELTPAQVAQVLGISRDAIYNWISRGWLPARRGPGGHIVVPFTEQTRAACRQRIAASVRLPAQVKAQVLQAQEGVAL